jgi:hypothetical protein
MVERSSQSGKGSIAELRGALVAVVTVVEAKGVVVLLSEGSAVTGGLEAGEGVSAKGTGGSPQAAKARVQKTTSPRQLILFFIGTRGSIWSQGCQDLDSASLRTAPEQYGIRVNPVLTGTGPVIPGADGKEAGYRW